MPGQRRASAAMFAAPLLALLLAVAPTFAQEPLPVSLDAGLAPARTSAGELAPDAGSGGLAPPLKPALAFAPGAVTAAEAPVEITVRAVSRARRQRESSAAVTVVELGEAKKQSADLGEVLARNHGIGVQRAGGLGSQVRFSLNGLANDQIRLFIDEVPLELAGYSQQIGDIPLLTLERVDVYRGVVPIRFGADALGGVVNLITPLPSRGSCINGYYQLGSFGTHRGGVSGYTVHKPSGLFVRATAYGDLTRNDYDVDVKVAGPGGRQVDAKLPRFHDAYRAAGGALELGIVKKPWAERLIVRLFAMKLYNELQNNLIMTVPYGEANYSLANYGANLRYDQALHKTTRIAALAGYSFVPITFIDKSMYRYNWRGEQVTSGRPKLGETDDMRAYDQTIHLQTGFARVLLTQRLTEGQRLELSLTPTYTTRSGEDRRVVPGKRDPLAIQQSLLTWVTGLAHVLNIADDRVENTLFAKHFLYRAAATERLAGDVFRDREKNLSRFGVGDSLRVRLSSTVYTKASYELTTRLPRPDEVFGNGVLVQASLELKPESSHNGNLELTFEQPTEHAGSFRGSVNGFVRDVKNQIFLLGATQLSAYQNVADARALGVEGNGGWTSPREYLALDANATYLDLRNTSSEGTFGRYEGDRLPSRPYLYTNASARSMYRGLFRVLDEVSLSYYLRYVHAFYRGWESEGARDSKQVVPRQISHSLALIYTQKLGETELSGAAEVLNLTDSRLYDQFGTQRPGRAFLFKLSFQR